MSHTPDSSELSLDPNGIKSIPTVLPVAAMPNSAMPNSAMPNSAMPNSAMPVAAMSNSAMPQPPAVVPVLQPAPAGQPAQTESRDGPALLPSIKAAPDRVIRENPLVTVLAWTCRIVTGIFLCCNVFPLSFITSIAVFGWLQRRMQAVILRGWWRESPRRFEGTFQDFCDRLGPDGPVERPRWFWRERIVQSLNRPRPNESSLGKFLRTFFRLFTLPVHSLGLNFKVGVQGLFSTYLLTGWGCSIMLFSWYFGWLTSFHKDYENAFLGLLSGIFGSFLLILSLIYVLMAQAHQAAAGEIAAFFQFRLVVRLILTRLTSYTMLIAATAFVALVFEIPRFVTVNDDFPANREEISVSEAFWIVEGYWLFCSIFFFLSLLILRTLSALIYRSAMLKAIRSGTILTSELPPRLARWYEKLEILPQAQLPRPLFSTLLRVAVSWKYRTFLFTAIFLLWMLFVMRFYASYFVVFNEYRGILNHPVVQVPCIDWTPWHLVVGREE